MQIEALGNLENLRNDKKKQSFNKYLRQELEKLIYQHSMQKHLILKSCFL